MSFDSILSSSEPASKPKEPSPIVAREQEIKQEREPRRDREPKRDSREPKQTKRSLEPEPDNDTEVEKDVETEPEPIPSREKEKEPAAKKRGARKSTKGRASDIRDAATPKNGRRLSVKKESPTPRLPAKRQANGQPKPKTWSAEMEKKIQNAETQIENRAANLDADEFDEQQYKERAQKRRRVMSELDVEHGLSRRDAFATTASKKLVLHAELGKRRYDDVFYDEALHEVREREVYAEKERKP
jgi:DNA helicase INO80